MGPSAFAGWDCARPCVGPRDQTRLVRCEGDRGAEAGLSSVPSLAGKGFWAVMASDQKCGDTATRASSQLHGCTFRRLSSPEGRSHVATSHAPTGAHSLTSQPLALRTCSWRRFRDPASSWSVFMTVTSLGNENYFVL